MFRGDGVSSRPTDSQHVPEGIFRTATVFEVIVIDREQKVLQGVYSLLIRKKKTGLNEFPGGKLENPHFISSAPAIAASNFREMQEEARPVLSTDTEIIDSEPLFPLVHPEEVEGLTITDNGKTITSLPSIIRMVAYELPEITVGLSANGEEGEHDDYIWVDVQELYHVASRHHVRNIANNKLVVYEDPHNSGTKTLTQSERRARGEVIRISPVTANIFMSYLHKIRSSDWIDPFTLIYIADDDK